jgi:ABC-type lipoprotein release transport system permease subunit
MRDFTGAPDPAVSAFEEEPVVAVLSSHLSGRVALAGAAAVLGICAGLAAFLPALRAASIDPMLALRTE